MSSNWKLIYAYDPLCGWCYGLIPALRAFTKAHPDVPIDVLPGGLFTGTPARTYASLIGHIRRAEVHLEQVTGRKPSEAFHAFIAQDCVIDAASERPSHAVLQVQKIAPEKTLEFAHRIQEVHYETGADLNAPATYDQLCTELGIPPLDTDKIENATLNDPNIAAAYSACQRLGPSGYPTIFIATSENKILGSIPSTYDPAAFVEAVEKIIET